MCNINFINHCKRLSLEKQTFEKVISCCIEKKPESRLEATNKCVPAPILKGIHQKHMDSVLKELILFFDKTVKVNI